MDDGRETSVQSYIFLILTCHSFEHYLLNIHQSILHIISKILQSFSEEINSFKKIEKGRNFCILIRRRKTISPLKVDTVSMFKHDEFVATILADIANKSRVSK